MRTVFTLVALVLTLAVVGLLARQQLSGAAKSTLTLPGAPGVAPQAVDTTVATSPPAQQVQQVQQAVEALVQQPRSLSDEAK